MSKKDLLYKLEKLNQEIWDIISDIHDNEVNNLEDIKEKLIQISGDLCIEIIRPFENLYDYKE